MVHYNFKEICIVPNAKDFIDIVLSKTQRKTPTVVHKRYKISSIRQFYMRKVKFCSSLIRERITQLLSSFPRVDNIHPFYSDLIHILYDKDHYKLALGQLNVAKNIVETICKDYIKLLKYGDSLYRCKQLKKAALGRMCTTIKKQDVSLKYLEEVRQHLARLPSIDPNTRTLIITGYPNVGKSSFINKVSRANVDVQPYAFTTKSLFVGHFYHKYIRWQIIDTPGILDHPLQMLDGCNTIEMQAITAIAHIQASVLFFIDISPFCEYSVEKQLHLFRFLQPIFSEKPIIFVASKCDLKKLGQMEKEDLEKINAVRKEFNIPIIELSNLSEEGIISVRDKAAEMLLESRLEKKIESKKGNELKNRLQITYPSKRDYKERKASIPESVKDKILRSKEKKTEKEIQEENGGAGVYNPDWREHWDLEDPKWKKDKIPEIFEGQNVVDWIDPDIEKALEKLEKEEMELEEKMSDDSDSDTELDEDDKELYDAIKKKHGEVKIIASVARSQNKPVVTKKRNPPSLEKMKKELTEIGIDPSKAISRIKTMREKKLMKQNERNQVAKNMSRGCPNLSFSLHSSANTPAETPTFEEKKLARRATNRLERKQRKLVKNKEHDRRIYSKMPKHLFSGKRKIGKTQRR